MDVVKRQAMYKSHTPPWKETYRKRCQDRLKKSRDKFVGRLRTASMSNLDDASLVNELMMDEWKILRSEQQDLPPLRDQVSGESIDEFTSVFEEIRHELIQEEQQILREYEAGVNYEDAAFRQMQKLHKEKVFCPVCQRDELHINKTVIFCRCGVRIETEEDCITLANVQQNIEEGTRLHESCPHAPQFSVVQHFNISNILMTCQYCDIMHIIV